MEYIFNTNKVLEYYVRIYIFMSTRKSKKQTKIEITNENIVTFVASYIVGGKINLPNYLKTIPISKWDVSRVTSMISLFEGYEDFNEPLNEWDVSKVTSMASMFSGCNKFNQPLDSWQVGKVDNMEGMFMNCEKFNQSLNSWDVSSVTDMANMFFNCTEFNQPLNNWNVSNVYDMSNMFNNCTSFNQPLNNWDVSNVMDMSFMFTECREFNQQLSMWRISEDTNILNMFDNAGISEVYKPRVQSVIVDATQVHKAASKINYNKLTNILKEKTDAPDRPSDLHFPTFINSLITSMIDASEVSDTEKQQNYNGLNEIMTQRLNGVNYSEMSPLLLDSIYYTLNYVNNQGPSFKNNYVTTFIQECVHAYEGEGDIGMTCAVGALERIVNSLVTPCEILISSGTDEDDDTKTQCELLKAIISYNPKTLVIEYIKDWYKLHTKEPFPEGMVEAEKRDNLKKYLLEKLPGEEDLIESSMEGLDFDDDAFQYSGGKRRTRRSRRNVKRRTTKKIVTTRYPKKSKSRKRKSIKKYIK